MTDRINLEKRAESAISEALGSLKHYDAADLRNALEDRAHEEADNVCIYNHWCVEIIQDTGQTFTASQWQEAQTAYAYGIASAALSAFIDNALTEIEEVADELSDLCTDAAGDIFEGELAIGADCPHGWAPHDREDENGTHFWSPAHLEGCHAIAREVCGVWLSFTWTPATVTADSEGAES